MADPLAFLAADPGDARILAAVVHEAGRFRAEQDQAMADYIATQVANQIVPGLARVQSRLMKWLAKRG